MDASRVLEAAKCRGKYGLERALWRFVLVRVRRWGIHAKESRSRRLKRPCSLLSEGKSVLRSYFRVQTLSGIMHINHFSDSKPEKWVDLAFESAER